MYHVCQWGLKIQTLKRIKCIYYAQKVKAMAHSICTNLKFTMKANNFQSSIQCAQLHVILHWCTMDAIHEQQFLTQCTVACVNATNACFAEGRSKLFTCRHFLTRFVKSFALENGTVLSSSMICKHNTHLVYLNYDLLVNIPWLSFPTILQNSDEFLTITVKLPMLRVKCNL